MASVMNTMIVSTNIATHGPLLVRSARSRRTELRCVGSGCTRSRVVAKVMMKKTMASAENTPIVIW
jgi:hypothetical protein